MKVKEITMLLIAMSLVFFWLITGNSIFGIFVNLLVTGFMIFRGKLNPTSPYSWFPFFVSLYNLSIFILDYVGVRSISTHNELLLINLLSLLGLFFSFLFIRDMKQASVIADSNISNFSLNLLISLNFILCAFVCASFIYSGAVVKSEFSGSLNSFFKFLNVLACIDLVKYASERNGKIKRVQLLLFLPFILFSSLLLGERDILFSYLIILIMVYSFFNGNRIKRVYLFSIILILMIPVLGEYKNLFTKTNFNEIDYGNIFVLILNGEFRSAGFNIDYILNNFDESWRYGSSIIFDLLRSIVPGFIYEFNNSVGWYNKTYHPNIVADGRGYGFSLSAEGYINFGYVGVFLWYVIVGSMIAFVYNNANKNTISLSAYFVSIPMFIYSIRGDLSTLLSPLFKAILIPIFIFIFIDMFIKRLSGFTGKKQNHEQLARNYRGRLSHRK